MPPTPRFIVDAMLGNLARWLRMLGYDTKYEKDYEDWQLIRIAISEDRILVTKDLGLFRRANSTFRKMGKNDLRAFYLEGDSIEELLAKLAYLLRKRLGIELRLSIDPRDTRCPICNGPLRYTTSLVEVAGKVPEAIANRYREFWICTRCGKVYWRGSHWRTIEEKLRMAQDKLAEISIKERELISKVMREAKVKGVGSRERAKT